MVLSANAGSRYSQMGKNMRLKTLNIGTLVALGNAVGLLGNALLFVVGDRITRSLFAMITFYGCGLGITLLFCGVGFKWNGAAVLDFIYCFKEQIVSRKRQIRTNLRRIVNDVLS